MPVICRYWRYNDLICPRTSGFTAFFTQKNLGERKRFSEEVVKVEELVNEFLALTEEEKMDVLRGIIPPFCRGMMANEEKVQQMFLLFAGECGREMKNMLSAMATMFGHKGCK